MKNFIPVKNYMRVESVTFNNLTDNSTEGHNYYIGFNDPNDVILESVNLNGKYVYDRVFDLCMMNNNVLPMMNLIGICDSSVFDENCPNVDEFGFVEINTEIC